jgi:hypothetical protein
MYCHHLVKKGIKRFYTTCLLRNPSAASTPFRISYPSNSSSRPPGMQCTPSWHLLYSVPCAADILANSSLHSGQILLCRRTREHELRRRSPLGHHPPPPGHLSLPIYLLLVRRQRRRASVLLGAYGARFGACSSRSLHRR